MSLWLPLHMYSLPKAQQWVPLSKRLLLLYPEGIVMLSEDMEGSMYVYPDCLSFAADETHWTFQKDDGFYWGAIDEVAEPQQMPEDHLVLKFSAQGMVTRCGFRKFWISFDDMKPVQIPHGCTKPKIYHRSIYWHEDGVFYCWCTEKGVRHVGQIPETFEDFLVGAHDWIAVTTKEGVCFLHYGHSFLVPDVMEVLFHSSEEQALLQRLDSVEVLSLPEQRFSTQYLPESDELIGFVDVPLILGLKQSYIYSTALFISDPDGKGPEFSELNMVLRNEHTVLGLAGSLWSWNTDDGTPRWIEDVPDFDDAWVGGQGYLLVVEDQLLSMNNQGAMEVIDEDVSALADHDVLEIEGLGMFVHFTRIEQEPVLIGGLELEDSTHHWAWSQEGIWIDLR